MYLQPPSLIISQMQVKMIEFVCREQPYEMFDVVRREEVSRYVQHETSIWQSGLIVYTANGNRQTQMCSAGDSVDGVELC